MTFSINFKKEDLSAFCFDFKKECLSYKSVKREEKQVNVRCNKNKDGSK